MNPFALHRCEALAFRMPKDMTWASLMRKLDATRFRGAVVGMHGSGKTTFLGELEPRLAARGFAIRRIAITPDAPPMEWAEWKGYLGELGKKDLILFDGAGSMTKETWLRFRHDARFVGGMIIAAEVSGLLPTLVPCRTSPGLLEDLVAELLGKKPEDVRRDTHGLLRKHRGNIRDCLAELRDNYVEVGSGKSEVGSGELER